MLIGELVKKTGLPKDTIRFYEKIGLIAAQERQAGTRSYKDYGDEAVEHLAMITQGKKLGFTLKEIKQLMDTWNTAAMPEAEQIRVIEHKLEEIAEKMQHLNVMKTYLTEKLSKLRQKPL
ncbi:MerR family transcriptional regulator [Pseudanabaena sp. FACHB-2040]|uniref:MerR family transcriptional regulator n=1 Tax=Pseudanabaena sp. FACHB-2040 TaxID=2692859 RepID=UPI001689B6C9|nr:MerR family transcriptional regulator [Pseudanabaena sp. FACHB-2040]MBD2258036.1 MerR family transcriptional regulator [Pseudanabaena sp. FACHB-2040]